MPKKKSDKNQSSILDSENFADQFINALQAKVSYESIIDFACHPSFCGKKLYPRQRTLLKLIYLETEHMTQFDLDVIEEWRMGFTGGKDSYGVQPDVWKRIDYLKSEGYRHFPHIEAVMGRRASKGVIGGILGAEKISYLWSLDDWQEHYGIEKGKDGYLSVIATNILQAKKNQFADIRETIQNCKSLEKYISQNNEYYISIRTPADLRRIAEYEARKITVDHEIATLRCLAMTSTSSSGRGAAGFANFFDEFAFYLTGTGGPRSSEEIYEAYQPSLDQFGKDSLTYLPSSPFTKVGYFFNLYVYGSVLMKDYLKEVGLPTDNLVKYESEAEEKLEELTADPEMLIVQLPSWELYRDWERGVELCGVKFKGALSSYDDRMKRLEKRNPEKFKVERKAQFAEVQDAYLDSDKVDQMFEPFWDDRILQPQENGLLAYVYEGHSDPSRSNANFAVCIAHLEDSPLADEHGQVWSHVIVDYLHVWKPEDYDDHTVDYVQIQKNLEVLIGKFPALRTFSFDAWNSAAFVAMLKEKFKYKPRIIIEQFNDKRNQERAEYFKSALNLGWIHSYRDSFFNEGQSLLETELKFLTEINGKVQKQTVGPCTTKDLADCHDDQTEVLTEHGWKLFKDVIPGEKVATRNSFGELEYQVPTDKVSKYYKGEMIGYDKNRTNFLVTPNHRMLVQKFCSRKGIYKEEFFIKAKDLSRSSNYRYPKTTEIGYRQLGIIDIDSKTHENQFLISRSRNAKKNNWSIKEDNILKNNYSSMPMDELISLLPNRTRNSIYNRANKVLKLSRGQIGDRQIDKPKSLPPVSRLLFAKFLGFWLAEGRKYHNGTHKGWGVRITQTKKSGINWFDSLLIEMGWEAQRIENSKEVSWSIKSKGLREYLKKLCFDKHELMIPDEVFLEWTKEEMEALLEGLSWGDGNFSKKKNKFTNYMSTSYRLMSDVQRLLAHIGMSGQIRLTKSKDTEASFGGKYKLNYDQWNINYDKFKNSIINGKNLIKVDYEGMVYCLTVPNGTLFTRRHGVAMWSGNCLMVVTHRLLHHQLDQWQRGLLGNMPMSKGLPSGKAIDPSNSLNISRKISQFERGTARSRLDALRDDRIRSRRRRSPYR